LEAESLSSLFLSIDVCQGDRMLAKIYSAAVYGVDAYEVEIEVNAAGGNPIIVIVGLPDAAVKESPRPRHDRDQQQRLFLAARPDHDQSCAG
jgi:hypothetical protein